MGKRIIIWDTNALHHFITILNHIKSESASNAIKVKGRIDKIIKALPSNPKMFRKDELKEKNDGSYRVFNKDNIRVSYKIEPKSILIARIRESHQEPMIY